MKLTKIQLEKSLMALARLNSLAAIEREKIANHCSVVYGVTPGDVDNDAFIDSCDGGCGAADGMNADEFDESMRECMRYSGIEMPE